MRPLRYLNGRTLSPVPAEARQGETRVAALMAKVTYWRQISAECHAPTKKTRSAAIWELMRVRATRFQRESTKPSQSPMDRLGQPWGSDEQCRVWDQQPRSGGWWADLTIP